MALTKPWLKEVLSKAGVSAEGMMDAVDSIMDGHVTSINALREEIATYKAEAEAHKADSEKLVLVQKELDALKTTDHNEWETKYQAEHEAFEQFKQNVTAEKALASKKALYAALLKEQHVNEKQVDAILKVTDFSSITEKDGKLENVEKLVESIKADWSGFIVSEQVSGANVDTPNVPTEGMTKEAFEKLPLSKQMEYANAHADMVNALYKRS